MKPLKDGDIIEYPFRSGKIWEVRDGGIFVPHTIPKRYRAPNTHRYKKGVT
jgi:hypothetical protein